ncbi:dihydrodipicolinate synthase family protein [Streptomyces sp. NP160]|uniref:dihydrodipicolinate synthase family protein n=1 Tax=Streptomyces sp. NP160 TaxID=2586637 RepID=UPI001118A015|nr:dihydrodipicolinate synthase family protein [Streptomyces sp. NP160]TNM61948.1 dihydrodipicolinate synthase family protein [Streptomyces sp. NP160]
MFTGLSAFPLTPLDEQTEQGIDEAAYAHLVRRCAAAGADSITALGSTGSYAYLTRTERARVAQLAVQHANGVPVIVGIGALRTQHVLQLAEDAQSAGASGVLLAPVSYQPLTPDDVLGLFQDVTAQLSVPLAVYDNPGTTRFTFTDDLYRAVAALPGVASIKIPGIAQDPADAAARVAQLRALLPAHVSVGISGDSQAARGLLAGCQAWYSVIGGTLPEVAVELTAAALGGDTERTEQLSARLRPLWDLFSRHGSYRTTAAVAEHLGLARRSCLPLPVRGLDDDARAQVARVVDALGL